MAVTLESNELWSLHQKIDYYARTLLDLQKTRIALSNRLKRMEREEFKPDWYGPDTLVNIAFEALKGLEKQADRQLLLAMREHFMSDWIMETRGIGLPGIGRLFGIIGPLDRFPNVAKLWAYLGLDVRDGKGRKRVAGEKANFSMQGRVIARQIADSIMKTGGEESKYRAYYDTKKAQYELDKPDWTKGHRHNAALRYCVKMLLRDMWVEWHRRQREAALPMSDAA